MSLFDVLLHLANLLLPAVVLALVFARAAPKMIKKGPKSPKPKTILIINILFGSATLLLGLAMFGHDGKIATYVLLIFVQAGIQWILERGLE